MEDKIILLTDDVIHSVGRLIFCVYLIDDLDIHFIRYYLRQPGYRLMIDVEDERAKELVSSILERI